MNKLTQGYCCGASYSQIIYETIGNYFDRTCEANPDGDALVVRHQGIRLSYSQLRAKVDQLATGLLALGIAHRNKRGGGIKSALLAVVTPPNPSQAPITVARFPKMPLQN